MVNSLACFSPFKDERDAENKLHGGPNPEAVHKGSDPIIKDHEEDKTQSEDNLNQDRIRMGGTGDELSPALFTRLGRGHVREPVLSNALLHRPPEAR